MSRAVKTLLIFFAFVIIYTISRHVADSSSTTTTTTTASASATTTTSASTTLPATTCLATDFSGVYNEGEGAAGTIYASITLTKNTPGTCVVYGWPLLTLQDKFGSVLTSSTVDTSTASNPGQFQSSQANAAPSSITLQQNVATMFSLAYSDVQTGNTTCANAVTLSVQFVTDGASIPVTPSYPVQPCNGGQILVSPFY